MSEVLPTIISALVGALAGALGSILIARYSKPKAERDSGIAADYLKLVDMSGEQLEKKINKIGQLEKRIDELEKENDELRPLRSERDEKLEAMEARIAALDAQIRRDTIETQELIERYQNLKDFTESIIAALEKRGIKLTELNGGIPDTLKFRWDRKP